MGLIDDLNRTKQEKNGLLASLDKAKAEQPNRPLSTTVKDIGVSVGAGVPNVLGTLADVVDMATGDSIDVVGQFGDAAKGVGQQILNEGLSPETLAQRQAISQTVANENAGIGDVAMSMFKNPMGALTMGAESAATMLVPGGAGVGLAKAAPTIGKLVPRVANALTPARAGAIGATGANALLNAGDTFGELEGQSLADRYLGASVPLAVSALLGPGMESMAVKRIIGAADTPVSNSIKEGLSNLGKGAIKGGAKEFVSEAGEGGSQAVGEAIGKGEEINPTQVGKQAFLEGALGAAPGAVGGGLSNVKMAEPKNEPLEQIEQTVAKLVEDAQANQAQPEDVVANVLKALGGLDDKYQESKPQEEVAPEPVAEQTEQTPVAEEPQAQTEVRRIDRGILQNRKRDDKDSVNQMRKIANAPDYGRVGYSRDFANGAPVVAFGSIPEEQKGRTDYAVSVTGERIPVQYAVVDADTVSTSNDINGAENPDYGLTDRVTAIAGNGRMTALGQAYRQGSAQAYRQEMTEDTMHGVNPQVIAKMKNPVLVRIMPNERVRDDIGDMSNISSNKSLSAIETARNDANRVDLDSLEFNDDGTPTRDSLSRFVSGMPDTERGSMMDKEGRATVQAVDRLNNAIFAKAYNNDDITAMYAEATDPEAKLVVNALARLAPKMAKLEGCGELDFRNALVDAVNAIVQGKRKGLKMQDILAQQDFLADPDVALFVELFARNPRSNKDVVAILSEAADFAYNEATKSDEDMFGEVQKASRGDVMNYVRDEFNKVKEAKNGKQAKQQANVQDASGGIGASQNVDGRDTGADSQSNERAGSANAQADESFSLSGQTEQEIIADEKAEEERQAQAEREEVEAEKQEEANNLRKEIDQRNEDYANDFTLEDDTVTGEDALRGQNALKFSRNPRTGKMDIKLSIAWHGSPHIFEVFLTDHIGTGEGAQAHGWGLYFAKDRDVAASYRKRLSRNQGGEDYEIYIGKREASEFYSWVESQANRSKSMTEAQKWYDRLAVVEDLLAFEDASEVEARWEQYGEDAYTKEAYDWFNKEVKPKLKQPGRLFKLEIPDENLMLDEQKQFKDQPKHVQDALNRVVDNLIAEGVVDESFRDFIQSETGWGIYWSIGQKYDAKYGDDFDSLKAASLALNTEGIPGITYMGEEDGRCYVVFDDKAVKVLNYYSKNKPEESTSGSTVDDVTESLESDKDIGEAFATLRDSGEVNVVQSIEDLPEEIRSQIDDSKKSWIHAYGDEEFTVDSPVSHVEEEWNKSGFVARFDGAPGIKGADVILTLGYAKDLHHGRDIVHAYDHAMSEPGRTIENRSSYDMVDDLIAQAIDDLRDKEVHVYKQQDGRIAFDVGPRAYILEFSRKHNAYLIVTRMPMNNEKLANKTKVRKDGHREWDDRGSVSLSFAHEAFTANAPSFRSAHLQGRGEGSKAISRSIEFNDSSFIANGRGGVKVDGVVVKFSDNGDIQGLYDPRTGKAYLIADALTDETAKPVFLHELGVHSAYGKNPLKLESQMKLARNMVNNGYAQGNDIAVRVKQRLFDANEIDSMDDPIPMEAAEECLSYLVEETASTDDRGPFRKWFDSLMSAIKQWLRNHGINVNLNEWDFVEMAKGNVVAMARQSGKDMSLAYSKKGKKSDVRNKTIDRKEPSYKSDERYGRFTEGGFRPEVSDDVKALRERDKKEEDVQFWKIWDTDEMGNLRWEFGRLVSGTVGKTKLGKDVARLIGNVGEAVSVATKMKRAPKGLRMQLRAMKAQIEQAGIDATEISKVMQKLTTEERSLISDYIENEMKADVHPAPYIVEIATKLTDILDKQADELVELGMLSKESRDRYRGHYLPRKYNKNKQENFFAKLFGSKSQMRGVAGGHLKGRGIFEEVPVEKVRTYISQGFEVRDPAYVYENGKVLHRQGQFEGMEAHNAKVLVWRDFSRAEREEMGEIRDASFRFAVGYMDTQRDLALGRLFKELASNPEYTSATARDGFEYIPKTEIPGTSGVFKYGALAGKYVDKTVLSHLAHIESSPNDFTRAFRQGMAFWKEGKTAMNPVSHMNNTVGNFTAAHFAGVNMWDMKTYNKAINAMRNGNETFKEGQKAGLFTGSFSQEEFVKSLPQELQGNVKGEEGWFKSSGDLAMKILTWGMRDKMRKAYEFEDAFFKMAIYIKAREKGLSPEEAVDYAHQYVFVYDTLPQGARALRDWALPFFAWTYQAIPMLANTAAHYPHRMLVPALVLHAINKAFYMAAIAMASDEDDDWVTLWKKASQLEDDVQETMPDYMSGYSALLTPKFLPIGINEATGLPRFFDMSHLIPGGNFFDVNNQMGGIQLPELIVPSHPVLNTVMALIGNRDSFTGRELYKDSDTDAEMLDTTAAYLWKQLSPALAFGNYHWSRLMDGVATATGKPILGYTGITKGGETITLDTAVLRFMGMKVRDYDAEKNAVKNINDNKRLMTEIKSGITRNRKDFGRGAITYEALDEFVKDQREKLERLAEANQKMSEAMGRIKANTKW